MPHLQQARCGSGDSFVTGPPPLACDLVDMEAYALSKVCYLENIPFLSIKYVTDGGDDSAHRDWTDNLPRAASAFRQVYDGMLAAATK